MNNLAVGMSDYANGLNGAAQSAGYGEVDAQQAADLFKAMEAGHLQGGDLSGGQTNMGSLKYESLDANLKLITFRESDIRVWRMITKTPAYNTVEEFNQVVSYGNQRGGFNNEGELPEAEDSLYKRNVERVKFMGVTRAVTHPAQLVKTQGGNLIQMEVSNGIKWILRQADRALLYGDENLISQEWNGLYAQHLNNPQFGTLEEYMDSPLVVDLRGKTLKEGDLDKATEVLLHSFAQPDCLIAPPVVFTDFAEGFYSRNRQSVGTVNGTGGNQMTSFQSQFFNIMFEYDIFATKGVGRLPNATSIQYSAKAPAAPTAGGTAAPITDTLTRFGDGEGEYFYSVTATNRYGESPMTQIGAGLVTVAANQSVDLTFTAGAGPYAADAFTIYRSEVDPSTTYAETKMLPLFTIPANGSDAKRGSLAAGVDGAGAGVVRDRNRWIGGTQEGLLLQKGRDVLEFKQLAPMMKMDIARLGPADRFMILMYGTPIGFAPSKMVRIINIGRTV